MRPKSSKAQQGQVAVLFAIAAVAIVAIVGLAVDAGQNFDAQRALQAGSDTAAQSGAYMLLSDYTACSAGGTLPYSDQDIYKAVTTVASSAASASETANTGSGISPFYVQYTGAQASDIPIPDTNTTADLCLAGVWTGIAGIQITTSNTHHTSLLGVIGIPNASARATATAIFGPPTGGAAPFAAWYWDCTGSTTGNPVAKGDFVTLYSPQWKASSCPQISPSSFKGYIYPQTPIQLPLTPGACIQTGVGVGSKVGLASGDIPVVGDTYLIPMIDAAYKGICPFNTPGPSGTYALKYAGLIAVKITSVTTNKISGEVTLVAPPTNGITICPVSDLTCNQGLSTGGPLGVELYK